MKSDRGLAKRPSGSLESPRTGWLTVSVLVIVASLAVAPRALATEAGTLTLASAIALARHNSLAVQTSEAKLEEARSTIAQTYAGLYPQLSLSESGLTYHSIDASSLGLSGLGGLGGLGGVGGLGGLGGLSSLGLGGGGSSAPLNALQTSLSLTQILFDGFQTADALKIADASLKMGQVDETLQVRTAEYLAAKAYFLVLETQTSRGLAEQNLEQANAHLDEARRKLHAGTSTRFDVLQAEAQVATTQGQLRSAQNSLALARLQLANALGVPLGDRAVDVTAQLTPARLGPASYAPVIDRGPEVQNLLLERRIDEAKIDLARKANYPHAQLQAQYSQQSFTSGRSFLVDAGLSWPLIDWGKSRDKTLSARLDLRQVQLQVAQARRDLATQIQGATLSRQDARDRVQIAARGLQSAQEAYQMSEVRYRAGVGTSYEVIDAQTALIQAQNTYVQANYQVETAEIALDQALAIDLRPSLATGETP